MKKKVFRCLAGRETSDVYDGYAKARSFSLSTTKRMQAGILRKQSKSVCVALRQFYSSLKCNKMKRNFSALRAAIEKRKCAPLSSLSYSERDESV